MLDLTLLMRSTTKLVDALTKLVNLAIAEYDEEEK